MTKTRILRPADIVLIGLIAAASLLMLRMRPTQAGAAAEIYRDGERCAVIDLRDPARQEFQFDGAIPVTIISENGAIWFESSDCPDQICVHQGWISDGSEPIVCLPNQVIIQITGGGSQVDAATG